MIPAAVAYADAKEPLVPLRTDTPPVIDGRLDDEIWLSAPSVTGFKTWSPDFGIDMVEQTEVYYVYDRENLYFGFRCFDSEPDRIKTSVTNRDNVRPDDWVAINLDSFNDQQSLYAFYINPTGIQGDSRAAAGREDLGFDMVWYSAGVIDEQGYTVEVRIPFKSIRFAGTDRVEMGVIFERQIVRLSELGTYPPLSPDRGANFQTQMQPLILENIQPSMLLEILPAVTHSQRSEVEEDELVRTDEQDDLSLTVKYGITSDLVLDGTLNPDFSQVETDAGQIDINLRSPLFFPEKRPFFLEGSEYFNLAGPTRWDYLRTAVHTRSIVDPAWGAKVSGKISEKNAMAAIYARDEPRFGGGVDDEADFGIFRYKRTLKEDSFLGTIYTGREREDGYNRVFGADGQFRLSRSATLGFHALASQTVESALSPQEDGHAVGVEYNRNTRNLALGLMVLDISEDFRTETGYITREGIAGTRLWFGPKFYPSSGFIQRVEPTFMLRANEDKVSDIWESQEHFSLALILPRSSRISATYDFSTEAYVGEEFDTGGVSFSGNSQLTKKFYVNLSFKQGKAIYYSADPYQGRRRTASATLRYQPSDKINSSLTYTYANFKRDSDSERIYDYGITRARLTYQVNKYLFFRGIVEHNSFYDRLMTDFLASFLYIPGTVVHFGYGSLYERIEWRRGEYIPSDQFLETNRGLFFKASYLWRL